MYRDFRSNASERRYERSWEILFPGRGDSSIQRQSEKAFRASSACKLRLQCSPLARSLVRARQNDDVSSSWRKTILGTFACPRLALFPATQEISSALTAVPNESAREMQY